uniref:Uncharacterized protein n=1 Tax=Arundo donax TaxID=35708 RepID=A0A0A8YQK5_ARUDO
MSTGMFFVLYIYIYCELHLLDYQFKNSVSKQRLVLTAAVEGNQCHVFADLCITIS